MNRILVIRGGAIGDFVLTLPAIGLLRDRFPAAQIEILGARPIIALAEKRFYADAVRSLESGTLAPFFAKEAALPEALIAYFSSFDLILSYLSDPHEIFQDNVKRCGSKMFIAGLAKPGGHGHAAFQLARPLGQIGLHLEDPAARIYSTDADRAFARNFFGHSRKPLVALHPGSGSNSKNWPIEKWASLGGQLFSADRTVLVVGGEADEEQLLALESAWRGEPVRFAKNLALPHLAALFESSIFVGHDSGISHIAAAAGARSLLLFGPTDPAVWAPANEYVTVLRAVDGNLDSLTVDQVIEAMEC